MNQKDNMIVIPSSVFVTFHRIARSLKGFYKDSKLIWFFFFTLCVPYNTPNEQQSEGSHEITPGCWIFKQAL